MTRFPLRARECGVRQSLPSAELIQRQKAALTRSPDSVARCFSCCSQPRSRSLQQHDRLPEQRVVPGRRGRRRRRPASYHSGGHAGRWRSIEQLESAVLQQQRRRRWTAAATTAATAVNDIRTGRWIRAALPGSRVVGRLQFCLSPDPCDRRWSDRLVAPPGSCFPGGVPVSEGLVLLAGHLLRIQRLPGCPGIQEPVLLQGIRMGTQAGRLLLPRLRRLAQGTGLLLPTVTCVPTCNQISLLRFPSCCLSVCVH